MWEREALRCFLFSFVFQAFPGAYVKCNCSFDLYLLSPQVWGRATLVDYCRNERHSDLADRTPCCFQCCPLCRRQAAPGERLKSTGALLAGQAASQGSTAHGKPAGGGRQREGGDHIKTLLAQRIKSSQMPITDCFFTNKALHHPPEMEKEQGRKGERRAGVGITFLQWNVAVVKFKINK